jgi:hypothetical protein
MYWRPVLQWAPILWLLVSQPVQAQPSAPALTLNHLPGGTEVAGRPPELFAYLRADLFAAVDPLDARVVIFGRNGMVVGSSVPLEFFPTTVRETPSHLEYVNSDGSRYAVLPRSVTPQTLGSLEQFEGAFAPPVSDVDLRRKGAQLITLRVGDRAAPVISTRALEGGYLASARLLGRDENGRYYVQTSEVVRVRPVLDVRVFVQQFSPRGTLLGTASVPVASMDSVPSRFVALAPSGRMDVIIPTKTGVFLQQLSFRPRGKKGRQGTSAGSAPILTPITATVHESSEGAFDDGHPLEAPPVINATTRKDIIDRAHRYLAVNWVMRAENFSRTSIDNQCTKTEGKFWLRPRRFTERMIDQRVGPMPYHWGGSDTPESFRTKITAGALAGNVCTCREPQYNYCQVSYAAGVDCSGFVSGSWGVSKLGTSNLHIVAVPVATLSQLRPGDALNKPGSHVRLFVGVVPGPELRFQVIESTTNLRCEGVCSSSYSLEELAGYTALRFLGVRD